ncbi:MAG: hypothetical protein ACRDPC_16425 [Solirubrobacteraceae bacterium]
MTRTLRTAALATALAAAMPAAAQAATVTVTGDDGNPVAIDPAAPPTIRNMDVQAVTTVTSGDGPRYRTQMFGPDNAPASTLSPCLSTSATTSWRNFADYRGNGGYRVVVQRFRDGGCTDLTRTLEYGYAIAAGVGIAQPQNWLLTRQPNSVIANEHRFAIALNPGAASYEVRYARGGVIGPDGAISGPSEQGFVDTGTGTVPLRFDAPGDWVIVARAKTDDYFTPWSTAVSVRVKGPFDLERVTFPDQRGPRYRLKGFVNERAAAGRRVIVALARGRKGGKFRRLGRARVRRNGTFALRFKVRRTGRYRLRYRFRGSALVARGTIVQGIRIRRRLL